jgi:hypothetical protein
MKSRCGNPTNPSFKRYGAMGIKVCEQWEKSFLSFLADVGERPSRSYQLDRINSRLGYQPGNVRWVTTKEQQRNRSNNVRLTYMGETLAASEWAERMGINRRTLQTRLLKGWSVERALLTPVAQLAPSKASPQNPRPSHKPSP